MAIASAQQKVSKETPETVGRDNVPEAARTPFDEVTLETQPELIDNISDLEQMIRDHDSRFFETTEGTRKRFKQFSEIRKELATIIAHKYNLSEVHAGLYAQGDIALADNAKDRRSLEQRKRASDITPEQYEEEMVKLNEKFFEAAEKLLLDLGKKAEDSPEKHRAIYSLGEFKERIGTQEGIDETIQVVDGYLHSLQQKVADNIQSKQLQKTGRKIRGLLYGVPPGGLSEKGLKDAHRGFENFVSKAASLIAAESVELSDDQIIFAQRLESEEGIGRVIRMLNTQEALAKKRGTVDADLLGKVRDFRVFLANLQPGTLKQAGIPAYYAQFQALQNELKHASSVIEEDEWGDGGASILNKDVPANSPTFTDVPEESEQVSDQNNASEIVSSAWEDGLPDTEPAATKQIENPLADVAEYPENNKQQKIDNANPFADVPENTEGVLVPSPESQPFADVSDKELQLSPEIEEQRKEMLAHMRKGIEAIELSEQQQRLGTKLTNALKTFAAKFGKRALLSGLLLSVPGNIIDTDKTDAHADAAQNQQKASMQSEEQNTKDTVKFSATDLIKSKDPVVSIPVTNQPAADRFADSVSNITPSISRTVPTVPSEETAAEITPETVDSVAPQATAQEEIDVLAAPLVPPTETVTATEKKVAAEITPQFTEASTVAEQAEFAAPRLTQEQTVVDAPDGTVGAEANIPYKPKPGSNMWPVSEELLGDTLLSQIPENKHDSFIDELLKSTDSNEALKEAIGFPEDENGERSVKLIRPDRTLNVAPFIEAARELAYRKYIDQKPQTAEVQNDTVESVDVIPSADELSPLAEPETTEEVDEASASTPETQTTSETVPQVSEEEIQKLVAQIEGKPEKRGFLGLFSGDASAAPSAFSVYADTPMSALAQVTAEELAQKGVDAGKWNLLSDAVANMVEEGVQIQPDETLREYLADYIANKNETTA